MTIRNATRTAACHECSQIITRGEPINWDGTFASHLRCPPRIFKWVEGRYQPDPEHRRLVVDCKLYDMETTRDVFWTAHKNSYVLVYLHPHNSWLGKPQCADFYFQRDGEWFELVSINGAGEVRWAVSKTDLEHDEEMEEKYPDKCVDGAPGAWDCAERLAAARHFRLIP